jgi:hypothetical protein
MTKWVEAATTDPGVIRNWFTHLYADHGVGLAMGLQPNGRMIFALDVDEHDPAHSGSETLADLQAEHGNLPDTWCSITGSGGLHYLFAVADGSEVRNGTAGDGLDIRGEGGQIVVAPSVHPGTGGVYAWEDGFAPWEREIADAPEWLLAIIAAANRPPSVRSTTRPSVAPTPFADPDTDSPAEWLRERWDWKLQLGDAAWTYHHTDRQDGSDHYARPGKTAKEGSSAQLHPGGPFNIYSDHPSLSVYRACGRPGRNCTSLSPFDFYTAHRHGGDTLAAGRAIRALMDPAPSPASRLSTAPPVAPSSARRLKRTPASAINLLRVHWLWEQRIVLGELSLLAGPEGLGKSTLAYWLASEVTRGGLEGEVEGEPRSVLVCATEDSWEHTVAPRLHAHGADLDRVFRMDVEADGAESAEMSLPADLAAMEEHALEVGASLLILDPLMSRLDSRLDTHRDGEVRLALEPLTKACRRVRMACVGLIHLNKSGSTNPLDLIMASKAFPAVARTVNMVIRDPDDDTGNGRLFGTEKNNLGRMDLPTRTFTIESWTFPTNDEDGNPDGFGNVGRLKWGADSMATIKSALLAASATGKTGAYEWLRDYMARNGPEVDSKDVLDAADKADIGRTSLYRAREKLRLDKVEMGGVGGGRRTVWFDPTDRRLAPATDPNPIGDIT